MKEEKSKLENSLMIPEKENIFSRFFKWISNIFGKKEQKVWQEGPNVVTECPNITIPKAVKMPAQMNEPMEPDENSLEYLYKLSDQELDDLNELYDNQMEEAKNELLKLDNILQTYKQSIKKLQGQMEEEV